VETHLRHLHEAAALDPLEVRTQVLGADEKRLQLFHAMSNARTGDLLATGEHLLLHVDTRVGRTCPWVEPVAGRVAAAAEAHAALPVPEGAGRAVEALRSQQGDA
jgi:carnitine 3-dehydrogenase